MTAKAMADMAGAAVIVGDRHAEMQLDVGHFEVGIGFEKAAAFGDIRGDHADALLAVTADFPPQLAQSGEAKA